MNRMWLVLAMALMSGCVTTPIQKPVDPVVQPIVETVSGASNRVAVCVGLTAVDPAKYDGWNGICPGCDVDANGLFGFCVSNGISARLILNSSATWKVVRSAITNAASGLKSGDLIIVTISGHGGQLPDDNGDEEDGLDETICLWDGQVRDDEVLKMINSLPHGIRLVLINDQCHSEGNFRSFVRYTQRIVSLGTWGKKKGRKISNRELPWSGQLIQFAGCREASYSFGGNSGGTWTQSLLKSYHSEMSWRQWFDSAFLLMPGNQVPQWVEYGPVNDTFRSGPALK